MNKRIVKTRIAPSPTGFATIGNLRTALFNYLFAKKHGGEFLIRIEDTDYGRFVEGAEEYIINSLKWLGINPDFGVDINGKATYKQSEKDYSSYINLLIEKGFAYYAFDTSEELDVMKKNTKTGYTSISRMNMKNSFTMSDEEVKKRISDGELYVIRFNVPRNKVITFKDVVKGNITFDSNSLDDKVLQKFDKKPTYHLCNIVDDHLMEITHVIRGDEWVSSTPLHIMLYEAFGWDKPEFCHVPLVLGPDKKKLSKRKMKEYGFTVFPMDCSYVDDKENIVSVTGFKEEGFEPDALLNFLALLGWNPGGTEEIMTIDRMVELFQLDRINSSGANFDIEKLKHFNAHYIRNVDNEELFVKHMFDLTPDNTPEYSDLNIIKIVDIAKKRSVFTKDLYPSVSYFFEPIVLADDVVMKNPKEFREVMHKFISSCKSEFGVYDEISEEDIKPKIEEICAEFGYKIGKILPDLRTALTGGIPGPELETTMSILGMSESIRRILALNEKYIYQDCK